MSDPKDKTRSAPLETEDGDQMDDNVDDLGHRKDGSEMDQPVRPDREEAGSDQPKRG